MIVGFCLNLYGITQMWKDSLIVKDMSDIIFVCENLKVVLTGTHVQTKVNLSNQLCFQAKGKTKRRQLIR